MTNGPDDELPAGAVRVDPDWEDEDDEVAGPDGERWSRQVVAPAPVGVAAFALAVLSFFSLGALDITAEWITSDNSVSGLKRVAVGDVTVHLIVGGIALLLALTAMYLDDEGDERWIHIVSRAALVIALIGLVLHAIGLGLDLHHTVKETGSFLGG